MFCVKSANPQFPMVIRQNGETRVIQNIRCEKADIKDIR